MADAVVVFDDGHAGERDDGFDEPLAAARDDEVEPLVHACQHRDALAVGEGDELDGVLGRAGLRRGPRRWRRFEWIASLPPRRMVALPVLKHSTAASAVTFGRLS